MTDWSRGSVWGSEVGISVLGVGLRGNKVWLAPGTKCQKFICALWLDEEASGPGGPFPSEIATAAGY